MPAARGYRSLENPLDHNTHVRRAPPKLKYRHDDSLENRTLSADRLDGSVDAFQATNARVCEQYMSFFREWFFERKKDMYCSHTLNYGNLPV